MGGKATFAGTNYQARVIAYVYVHILAQVRLGWLGPVDDVPVSVAAETGGPGDDARIEFGGRHAAIEVQAKHGLTAGARLREIVQRIHSDSGERSTIDVVVAVDRNSSRTVHRDFAQDLDRLRCGREDGLSNETIRLLKQTGGDPSPLRRLHVISLDLDNESQPETKSALTFLGSMLSKPTEAQAAWDILIADATEICAKKLARTRKELLDQLASDGIEIRPRTNDERWHLSLDSSKQLLEKRHAQAALQLLGVFEKRLIGVQVEPRVRYRLAQQRGSALLQLERFNEALECSRRALDLDPKGVHALATGAFAAMFAGDPDTARRYADRAVVAAPDEPISWAARAQVAAFTAQTLPEVPRTIASSGKYRVALAQIAANQGDWHQVLNATAQLVAEGDRSPDVLFLRTNALLNVGRKTEGEPAREPLQEVERLATELMETVADDAHPYTQKALILRASARELLGAPQGAKDDLQRARVLAPDDPDALFHLARSRFEAGDARTAAGLLQNPVVDQDPLLLALRARVLAELDEESDARRDLEAAVSRIADSRTPDEIRLTAAEVALCLGDANFAQRLLDSVSAAGVNTPQYSLLKGRAAIGRGAIDEGAKLFREAARQDSLHRSEYLAELGSHLLKNNRPEDAIAAFDEAGEEMLPTGALPIFAGALLRANDLKRLQTLVDRVFASGSVPSWALDAATKLALMQEDLDRAVQLLKDALTRAGTGTPARIRLAACLVEMGRGNEARPYLTDAAADRGAPALDRMQIAQLMAAVGDDEKALPIAFQAFRDAPGDPRIHRAFIGTALLCRVTPPQPEEIRAGTHVTLRSDKGEVKEYSVFGEPPIDERRGELNAAAGEAAGLIRKRKGDVITRHKGTWMEQRWTVEAIASAISHAVQDAMLHYEDRFPDEPFFLTGFSVGDGGSVSDFAPLIASLEERNAQVLRVFAFHRKHVFPLGFVAKTLGGSLAEVMASAASDPARCGPLFVEWSDREGQERSFSAASAATEVVLTRSALQTAAALHLLEPLAACFRLIGPRSLAQELRAELQDAEKLVTDGQRTVASAGSGFTLLELEPGDQRLVARQDLIHMLIEWLTRTVRLEPRPLDAIQPPGSDREHFRELVGHSSYDAMVLAERSASLYADDLGLRRALEESTKNRSFSSVSLLHALAQRAAISADQRDEHTLMLVRSHYAFVFPTVGLLELALRRSQGMPHEALVLFFDLLAGPGMTPKGATRLAAQLVRAVALAHVQLVALDSVVRLALASMAKRWPVNLCAVLLARAAEDELGLLPRELRAVQRICESYARGDPPDFALVPPR